MERLGLIMLWVSRRWGRGGAGVFSLKVFLTGGAATAEVSTTAAEKKT